MMNHKYLFILFFIGFLPLFLTAQARFRGGIIAGVSASQIDGDNSAGYNKPGLVTGLRVLARLGPRADASIEMLYAQRGSQSEIIRDNYNPNNFSLTLNYIEVPIQWHYNDWLVEGDDASGDFYRISFNAGLSYARYFSYKFKGEPNGIERVANGFLKKNDISLLLGANFFFTKHFGLTLRWVRGIGAMYNPNDWKTPPIKNAWLGHCLYLEGVYMF